MGIKQYLADNSIDLDSDDLKEDLNDLTRSGQNFIKIYNLLSPFVDLREYEQTYDEIIDLDMSLIIDVKFGKGRRERAFKNFVLKNPKVIKLIKEIIDETN
jgi:hypothetical protein